MNPGSLLWAHCRRALAPWLTVGPIWIVAAQGNVDVFALTGQTNLSAAYRFEITGWGAGEADNLTTPSISSLNFGQVISSPDFATNRSFDSVDVPGAISGFGASQVSFSVLTNTIRLTANTVGIACGEKHTLLLKRDGTVEAIGSLQSGQASVPPGLPVVVAVAAGTDHNLALTTEGKVVAWGWNQAQQLGVPSDLAHVTAIAAGRDFSLALVADGSVRAWGGAPEGSTKDAQEGGDLEPPPEIRRPTRNPVVAIAAGAGHALALRANGTVIGWGNRWSGPPVDFEPFIAISAGSGFSVGLRGDGTVRAWGDNKYHQLDIPAGLNRVVALACGSYHTLALRDDGTVVAWGNDAAGQSTVPPGATDVVAIAAGGFHSEILQHSGPFMTAPRVFNRQFSCELNLPAGRRYRIQASSDLVHWNTVKVDTAYPTRMRWEGTARAEGFAFYRVKPIWPGEPDYVSGYHR